MKIFQSVILMLCELNTQTIKELCCIEAAQGTGIRVKILSLALTILFFTAFMLQETTLPCSKMIDRYEG